MGKDRTWKRKRKKHRIKGTILLRTDGSKATAAKQIILAILLSGILLPLLITFPVFRGNLTVAPENVRRLVDMFVTGLCLLGVFVTVRILLSKYSPVKWLAVRKKLVLFTRLFVKPKISATLYHSVRWQYWLEDKKTAIDLYPNGLVEDTAGLGRKLSEYMGEELLKYEECNGKARYLFGNSPKRYDGMRLMGEGISKLTGRYEPKMSYAPIPIYDNVVWDFNSESLHILLIAPSGAGKTRLLTYLAGMAMKRGHKAYVVDAKNSVFGRVFRHSGVQVATNTEEIIMLLTSLVDEMEERYSKYFAADRAEMDEDLKTLGLKEHFLFFDEILSVLGSAGKKERAEIERLLGQLALKGRAAGFPVVITAQKLSATDLPKSITEQCQTRFILGGLVSEETFHQATGAYKKDIAAAYKGGVGKGYAVTPKSGGLTYIETPLLPRNLRDCIILLKELRDRGTPYGEGR